MRAVNLLPRDVGRQRSIGAQHVPALVGAGVGVLVVAVLAYGYTSQSTKVAAAQAALNAANAQLAATPLPPAPPKPSVSAAPAAVAADQPARLAAVSSALSQRIAWDRVLREVSLVLPSDVFLTSLTMSAPAGPFLISGSTYSYDSVARLLSRLSLVPDLSGVQLTSSTLAGRLVNFNVSAAIKGPVAPAAAPTGPYVPPGGGTTGTTTSTTTTTG